MGAMAFQITVVSIVSSTVCSGADQRKHQSSAPLAFETRASNAENVSIWWRHHATKYVHGLLVSYGILVQDFFTGTGPITRECPSGSQLTLKDMGKMAWVGLLSQFPLFRYSRNFSTFWRHASAIENNTFIWQVFPQFCCGYTCQIWMWFKASDRYFWKIRNFASGVISE